MQALLTLLYILGLVVTVGIPLDPQLIDVLLQLRIVHGLHFICLGLLLLLLVDLLAK